MKRISIAVIALVACMAVALVPPASGKKKKKVKKFTPTVTLAVAITEPTIYTPGEGWFTGQVRSRGPGKCRSGRAVTISRNGIPFLQIRTGRTGAFVASSAIRPPAGSYTATAARVVIKKKHKKKNFPVKKRKKRTRKKVCRAGISNAFPVT